MRTAVVPSDAADLLERNRELRSRLEEAEDALRAIGNGEVDALVVSGRDGDHVYTLKGADEAYRILVQSMAEGALTLTREGLILFSNDQFASFIGVPLEKIIGSNIRRFFTREDAGAFFAGLSTEKQTRAEMQMMSAAGHFIPAYLSISALILDSGECFCLTVTDLTEQKRNEEIVASEKLARSILDQAAGAIVVVDPGGDIIRASRAAERLAGYPVTGHKFDAVFSLRDLKDATNHTFEELLSRLQQTGDIVGFEVSGRLSDSRTVSLIMNASVLTNENGQLLGCTISLNDVTDLKDADASMAADLRDTQLLRELAALLVSGKAAEMIHREILSAAMKLTGADAGTVQILDHRTQELTLLATEGFPPQRSRYVPLRGCK